MSQRVSARLAKEPSQGEGDPTFPSGGRHMSLWNGFDLLRGRSPSDKSGHD